MTDGPQRPVPGPPLAVRPTRASATPRCRSNRSSLGSPSWTASRRLTTWGCWRPCTTRWSPSWPARRTERGERDGARLDGELVRRGLARSRRHAAELVAAGRVTRAGTVLTKPSTAVGPEDLVEVTPDPHDPGYASRAAFKLAGVLDALDAAGRAGSAEAGGCPVPRSSTVRDASTSARPRVGSPTCCCGAARARSSRSTWATTSWCPRCGPTRASSCTRGSTCATCRPSTWASCPTSVGDLSFISLAMVLPAVAGVVGPGTDLLLLVKPQFEVGRERLGSGGVVRDPALHVEVVAAVARHAALVGLRPLAVVPSPLPGPSGNREYFWWLRAGTRAGPTARRSRTRRSRAPRRRPSRGSPGPTAARPGRRGRPHRGPVRRAVHRTARSTLRRGRPAAGTARRTGCGPDHRPTPDRRSSVTRRVLIVTTAAAPRRSSRCTRR